MTMNADTFGKNRPRGGRTCGMETTLTSAADALEASGLYGTAAVSDSRVVETREEQTEAKQRPHGVTSGFVRRRLTKVFNFSTASSPVWR